MPKHIAEGVTAASFTGTNVSGSTGSFTVLSATLLSGTSVSASFFTGSNISGSTGTFSVLTGSSISGSTGTFSVLSGTLISGTNISGSVGTFGTVTGTYFSGTYFSGTSASFQNEVVSVMLSGTSGTFQSLSVGGYAVSTSTFIPVFGGLYGDYGLASLGGVNDPTFSVASGVFQAISASLTAAISSTNGFCSATIENGRVYVGSHGVYDIHCDTTLEINATNLVHTAIFITGTEYPRFSQAVDMTMGDSKQFSISALSYLASGAYVDMRVRKGAAGSDTITLHHFNFELQRIAPSGS